MFKIGTEEHLPEVPDVAVWSDSDKPEIVYALPNSARLRMLNGFPQLKFIKYRGEVGGKKGGFVFFDTDLALSDEESSTLVSVWQARVDARHQAANRSGPAPQAKIGSLTYTRGNVALLFEDNSAIVSRVAGAAKPSLYSANVASFMLELNEDQVPILEGAMKGIGSSGVTVVYDVYFQAEMPPAHVHVEFHARRFESFIRTTDAEASMWREDHYNDDIAQTLSTHKFGEIEVNVSPLPDPEATEKLRNKLRDWGFKMFNDAIAEQAANMLGLIPDEQKGASQTYLDKLGGDDMDDLHIELRNHSFFDFKVDYRETSPVEWNLSPQGAIPTVETIKKPGTEEFFKWEDFVVEVEPDAFFDELHVYAKVNADFDRLPIHSVQINIEHDGEKLEARPLSATGSDDSFFPLIESADDVLHFADFVDGVDEFDYWFVVNYKNQSRTFESEKVRIKAADREPLVINLDNTGILSLDVRRGDIDFDTVALAEVVVSYEDRSTDVGPFEERYFIDKNTTEAQTFQHVIFGPRKQPYHYEVSKLRLNDGTEVAGAQGETPGPTLHVDDIFTATRMIRCSGVGNMSTEIDRIEVNITYTEANGYTIAKVLTLKEGSSSGEWPVRVTALDAGTISYNGQIFWKTGETKPIETTSPESDSFVVGEAIELTMPVTVIPDGLFTNPDVLKVIMSGSYTDPETAELQLLPNQIISRTEAGPSPASFDWTIKLREDEFRSYEWKARIITTTGVLPEISGSSSDTVLVPTLESVPEMS